MTISKINLTLLVYIFLNNYKYHQISKPPTWIRIRGDKAYISGHGPQNPDDSVAGPFGKIVVAGPANLSSTSKELTIEQSHQSAKLAGLSILGTLKRNIGNLDKVTAWLQVSDDKYCSWFYTNNYC